MATGRQATTDPAFEAGDDPPRLEVRDPIQRRRYPLETDDTVRPRPAPTDRFHFPVDAAVAIETSSITLPYVVPLYVRDEDGRMVMEAEHFAAETLPEDRYVVELNAPVKLYLEVSGPLSLVSTADRMALTFGEDRTVLVGARSYHERPAATIETTERPEDVMAALSALSSSLKTTSPERSFPTLRGHPPEIELGEALSIPRAVDPPGTGVGLAVPSDLRHVYAAASLSFYLGARLHPGPSPRLFTDAGFERPLPDDPGAFEDAVGRILQQVFYLDCLTRTEGFYRVSLHEREVTEERIDLPFADLYEASLARRLEAYLDVPFSAVEDQLPVWGLVTDVTPTPESVELLPYVVDELSLVRTTRVGEGRTPEGVESAAVGDFVRGVGDDGLVRSIRRGAADPDTGSVVRMRPAPSFEQAWIGEGRPVGANKLVRGAFENKFDRRPPEGNIGITVVCNDRRMAEEYDRDLYGDRRELPLDVTVRCGLTARALREVFSMDVDFLHYIGHVEENEFVCVDGGLDAGSLEDVGVRAFLLNGCESYAQGLRLLDAGSLGGIVTLSDVGNDGAIQIGRTVARLLNCGFSLRSALAIAREEELVGSQYVVIGDGGAEVAQNESIVPVLYRIEPAGPDRWTLEIITYPAVGQGMGVLYIPYLDDVETQFLTPGPLPPFTLDTDDLVDYLSLERLPVVFENELTWSTRLASRLR